MFFEFHKGSNATVATKNICDVYPSALDVRKCQRWFSKFRSGNFNLSDSYRSGNFDDTQNVISRYFAQKPIDFYRSGIKNLHTRWQKVVDNEGDYIID